MPGPTSSQVGFLIGLRRAGWGGALAAWIGFTLPSALLMCLAAIVPLSPHNPSVAPALQGLMLTAVAVVGHAVWSMQRALCPDAWRRAIALAACVLVLLSGSGAYTLAVLAAAALAGMMLAKAGSPFVAPVDVAHAAMPARVALCALVGSYVALAVLAAWCPGSALALAHQFFRAGLLVFGGGHVVLPLLHDALVPAGWVSEPQFLAAYGWAQVMPGPLFAMSANLGAIAAPQGQVLRYALVALCALFLPGLLACVAGLAGLKYLDRAWSGAALAGVNAGVVGVLAAAFCSPVWRTAVHSGVDILVVVTGILLLLRRSSSLWVAALCVSAMYAEQLVA